METNRISQQRLSQILKETEDIRIQPTPRLAFIRHKVKTLSLQDSVVVHIKQTSNSTFKVMKGFPSVGVKLISDFCLCTIRGGRCRGVNAFGRLQAYAALLIEDDSGNRFCLTLDVIGDLRSPWTGWLSLLSPFCLASSPSPDYLSLQLVSAEKRKEYLLAELSLTYLTPRNRESKTPCLELRDVVPGMTITAKWRWSSSQKLNMNLIECS
jgi:hypothetical protein